MRLRIHPLNEEHDRTTFSCGHPTVDDFLKMLPVKHQERKGSATLLAVDTDGDSRCIVGYYTVLPHQFRGLELPDPYRRGNRIGDIYVIPGALLARLGVNLNFQGNGIGKMLLTHALTRIVLLADECGCAGIVTDPIDDRARSFYEGFDFESLGDGTHRMIVAINKISAALGRVTIEPSGRCPAS